MDAFFGARVHYKERTYRKEKKNLEFVWRPSEETEILTHIMKDHYKWPDDFIFDLNNDRGKKIIDDTNSTLHNMENMAGKF